MSKHGSNYNESEGAEWEATVDSWKMFPDYDMVDYDRIRIDDIKAFIAHQRQQAVAEFAREVVALHPIYDIDDMPHVPVEGIHTLLEKHNIQLN